MCRRGPPRSWMQQNFCVSVARRAAQTLWTSRADFLTFKVSEELPRVGKGKAYVSMTLSDGAEEAGSEIRGGV